MESSLTTSLILVVEDEVIIAEDLILRLKKLGYDTVPYATGGMQALSLLEDNKVDLILMDINIKGDIDGIETAKLISEKFLTPIIYLTSLNDDLTISRAKKTAPYGYLSKTSNLNNLYTTIEMAIHRNRMEIQIKEKEELLSITLKSITDAVIGAELDGTIISWNQGAVDIFGYKLYEILGKNLSVLTPPSLPDEIPGKLDSILKTEIIGHYDTIRQNKNGDLLNISIKISPIKNIYGELTGVSLIANDISEKKRMEREILKISENESRRIGIDLHDNLGQHLTGLMFQLKILENSLLKKNIELEAKMAHEITMSTKEAVVLTKNLAKNLIKVNLENQGLSTAIAELVSFYTELYDIKFIYEHNDSIDQFIDDATIITQLYHIVQETLTNSIKHSNASKIEVILTVDKFEIYLKIIDNGNGNVKQGRGFGLNILKYRTNIING
ncbi:MAG: PAS domain S-box protein, partial [Spirochaetaceae bacterium]|nr:PAS domain S-box protein [Spirochaetaceae bacterium]